MKIAITGAAGYLGKQIITKLLNYRAVKNIVAIDRVEFQQTHKKIKSVVCDVTDKNIVHAFKGCDAVRNDNAPLKQLQNIVKELTKTKS